MRFGWNLFVVVVVVVERKLEWQRTDVDGFVEDGG